VPVRVPWSIPPGGLDRLPPFIGELRATAGAEGAARFPLGLLLLDRAAQLLLLLVGPGGLRAWPEGMRTECGVRRCGKIPSSDNA
jgi:hypothetical protein